MRNGIDAIQDWIHHGSFLSRFLTFGKLRLKLCCDSSRSLMFSFDRGRRSKNNTSFLNPSLIIKSRANLLQSFNFFQPTELNQSPLLRTSPLGLFIRKTCLSIERMSFTEIWNWFESTKEWFQPSSIGNLPHSPPPVTSSFSVKPKPLSNPQALLLTALGYLQEGSYDLLFLSLEECFKISRSFGDKITLRGCWSLSQLSPS